MKRSDTGEPLPPIVAKTLVSVTVRLPRIELAAALQQDGSVPFTVIGDAEAPGTIQSAVFSGHRAAREYLGSEPEDGIFRREAPMLFA